jgi:dimethylhistidine N-methyltransferase
MPTGITFHDFKPQGQSLHDAVVRGFSLRCKSIPPKFFYDQQGSTLFDAICLQPEYYLPDVECAMLGGLAEEIAKLTGQRRVVIEPGAGSASKIRLLLAALMPSAYVAMDISGEHLKRAAHGLVAEHPWLSVYAVCADYTDALRLPKDVPDGPRLAFFPGSTLGNFEPQEAQHFLTGITRLLGTSGMLLIGLDTKKSSEILDAAYNDAAGMTAAFNLNLLHRMRRELDTDVDPAAFDHRAYYNHEAGRIEMHLVSRQAQRVRVNGQSFQFREGETLHTESSYKYTPGEFLELADRAGFRERCHWLDERGLFAIYLLDVKRGR